jgi:hypothetical protein
LFAYHLELQLRLTASRKPTGLIFWPISHPPRYRYGTCA